MERRRVENPEVLRAIYRRIVEQREEIQQDRVKKPTCNGCVVSRLCTHCDQEDNIEPTEELKRAWKLEDIEMQKYRDLAARKEALANKKLEIAMKKARGRSPLF